VVVYLGSFLFYSPFSICHLSFSIILHLRVMYDRKWLPEQMTNDK
jgi:hypothetical protein